jgi:small-conductance mechanosensitive channel
LLTRATLTAKPLSATTQGDIIAILQQEQEHALSLLSLSPLLSSLFVSYASRAGARGPGSATASADSEEWRALQDTITSLREENEKLKLEAREVVRKLEMAEASQEMLRSQVSSLDETNATHREDIRFLQTELVEVKEKYNRVVTDSDAEKGALRVKVSDLEVGLEWADLELDAIFDVFYVAG